MSDSAKTTLADGLAARITDLADRKLATRIAALDRYFEITSSLYGNGCEHGFKPAKACPNPACEGRQAHEAWEALAT